MGTFIEWSSEKNQWSQKEISATKKEKKKNKARNLNLNKQWLFKVEQ